LSSVKIKKGQVLVYRIFDIAEEIDLAKVSELLKDPRGTDKFKVPKFIERGLIMKSRPFTFGLGEVNVELECGTYKADVLVKVRDYGVLSLVYQIQINEGASWSELVALATDLEEGSELDQIAKTQVQDVSARIATALKRSTPWDSFEDYIIYFLEEFSDDTCAKNLLERVDVPALLLAEENIKIAKPTRDSILENVYQYSENDLAIVEWNSALVVEPGGGRELPDIIEFAVTHLLEMRFYDDLLDKRLAHLYDDIEKVKGRAMRGNFMQLYKDASTRYIEFLEFIERVENSLKVVGDFYLAIVYRAATRKFRLADWQQNVTRKINILGQVSNLLQGEVNIRRSHWMEITIILLIAFEIISALFKLF
jgi:hypothetical protein